jgi:hypothetical protein
MLFLLGSIVRRVQDTFAPPPSLSFAIGITVLALCGRIVASIDYIDPNSFHRFHLYINPQTLYCPTASQLSALAHAAVRRDQVAVVLGGSSVIWGAGESDAELWSRKLQADLGDGYRVLKFAMPSGSPQEFGAVAAEALLKDGYKVVLVADVGSTFGPPDGLFYPYVYSDARYKGMLLDNPLGDERIQQGFRVPNAGRPARRAEAARMAGQHAVLR